MNLDYFIPIFYLKYGKTRRWDSQGTSRISAINVQRNQLMVAGYFDELLKKFTVNTSPALIVLTGNKAITLRVNTEYHQITPDLVISSKDIKMVEYIKDILEEALTVEFRVESYV